MKFLPRFIIAFAICLLAIPALTTPVQASTTIKLSEYEGYMGDEIEVSGKGFTAGKTVYIYYDEELQDETSVEGGSCKCHTTFTSDITIPESSQGYHYIEARTGSGRTATAEFIVKPKISQDEKSGHVGDIVKVEGSGFPSEGTGINIRYYLDTSDHFGLDSSPYVDFPVTHADTLGSWEQEFAVPASTGGTHSIDAYYDDEESTLDEVNNDETSFKIRPSMVLSSDSGYVGDTIAVSGAGFARDEGDVSLRYDDSEELADGNVDEYGDWGPLNFTIPPCAKGDHLIEVFHDSSSTAFASATFTVGPGISLSPAMGYAGQTFSVVGTAFDPNIMMKISYQDQTSSVTTDDGGNLPNVTFTASGKHGNQQISATYDGSSTCSATFHMEGTPPGEPSLISPINAERIGGLLASFAGKIRPQFEWLTVTDASGITSYNLQIANSMDFSAPVVSTSIASGNPGSIDDTAAYTLPQEYALSYGGYYWRVKAIDAADNEGDWSEAQSFHAGWLPRWAMFASSAALLLLIIVIGLAIRRRRGYYYY
ncbi:MAG: hypothetical protein JW732_07020 [Dehalococcoidia bacterium]|nr:hypothetical protein [Dehalococcoidia bacterium]